MGLCRPDSVEKGNGCEDEEYLIAKQSNGHSFIEQTNGFALKDAKTAKIYNCIANRKVLLETIRRVRKAKRNFHIS